VITPNKGVSKPVNRMQRARNVVKKDVKKFKREPAKKKDSGKLENKF